jgi:hypothetical protein
MVKNPFTDNPKPGQRYRHTVGNPRAALTAFPCVDRKKNYGDRRADDGGV